MKSPITKLAAAAVIIIAILIGIHQFYGSIESVAWGDVVKQIGEFQPYICKQTIRYEGRAESKKTIMRLSLSRRREIWENGNIYVFDMSERPVRILKLNTKDKTAVEKVLTNEGPLKDPDMLRILAKIKNGVGKELGRKKIDGRLAKGFYKPDPINEFTVWVDAKTALPILIEIWQPQLNRTVILEDFQFDVDFDQALFETTAPKGYTVKKQQTDLTATSVSPKTVATRATFKTYLFAKPPSWTQEPQIIEATDPTSPSHKMYVIAAVANDRRHVVLAQSDTFNKILGEKVKGGKMVYSSANGFKVWAGGPDKWYSEILFKSAFNVIHDQPSEDRIGYVLQSPAGTFIPLAVNGPITNEELHNLVDSLVPANDASVTEPQNQTDLEKEKLLDMALKISGKKLSADERGLVIRMLSLNEKDLIEGLRAFLEISGGKYPINLDPNTTITECESLLKAKYERGEISKEQATQKSTDIFFAGTYYHRLIRQKKNPAYYGDKVTAKDSNKVLIRWKINKDKYRIVFGDLTTKDLAAEGLTELEKSLSQ